MCERDLKPSNDCNCIGQKAKQTEKMNKKCKNSLLQCVEVLYEGNILNYNHAVGLSKRSVRCMCVAVIGRSVVYTPG